MVEIAVTDTHPLVWYARREWRKLGPDARSLFERAEDGRASIYVPTLALVEVGENARRGKISLRSGVSDWTAALFDMGSFFPVDLTVEIVLRAEELYSIPERGDRLIAATAAHLGYPLITRDPEIAAVAGVDVVW